MSAIITQSNKAYYAKTFTGLDLSYEEFSGLEFEECTFRESNLSDTLFEECKFIDCLFVKSNLSLTKFNRSRLIDVTFDQCKLIGVDWTKLNLPSLAIHSPIKFTQCILNDASFFGLSLTEIEMSACKAHGVDFRSGNFFQANFSETDFLHALFNDTNLKEADFSDAINYQIDINYNEVKGAKFCRAEAISLLQGLAIELVD